jgi:DNA-binding response OmpR family regulator
MQSQQPVNLHKRVLCVDDDPTVLDLTKELLEYKGFEVTTADCGQCALEHIRKPFDLVIVDYNLPDFNGDVVARRWKQARPAVPILMFTGCVDLPEHALDHVNAHLTKGVGMASFFHAISQLIDSLQ